MTWLLTYSGTTKSFSDWGLSNLRRNRVSQAQDTVSFSCPGPYDATELFPYGSIITISFQPDVGATVPWFYGKVIQVPRSGSGSEESMDYVLAGPWWFLDNLVFQQEWEAGNPDYDPEDPGTEEPTIPYFKSRVILGQTTTGTRQTSGQVISDVINYAIASGAPVQLGTIEPDLQIPFDEQNDITCAEAIRRMLRWSPDAIAWFDYSTSPYPTFHCARRSALQSLAIALSGVEGSQPSALSVMPRPDIQVPAVVLKFEQTNTINGVDYESVTTQKFPLTATGREFAALTATLQLAGTQATILSQKIKAKTIDLIADNFWIAHDDTYLTTDTMVHAVQAGTHIPAVPPYWNELIEGQIQDWMTGVHFQEVIYTAIALVTIYDNAAHDHIIKKELKALSCKIIATDACGVIPPPGEKTQTYQRVTSLVAGETVPVGLAESIYNSLNPLQYDGKITLTEEECGLALALSEVEGRARLGFTLNLSGGLAAWATMNALIQQIEEDVDSGITTISFGPPEQLSVQDLMEFLRANRGRGVAFSYQKRVDGQSASGSGGAIELSGPTPLFNTAGASGQTKLLVVTDDTRKINLDPAAIAALTSAVTELKIKEVAVCDNELGKVRYMLTLASDLYDK